MKLNNSHITYHIQGKVRRGGARPGKAWHGLARQGKAGHGLARYGKVGLGKARRGEARHCLVSNLAILENNN